MDSLVLPGNVVMKQQEIPSLLPEDLEKYLRKAAEAPRRRYPKILHEPGADFNEVFNFMMEDTYMQPHLHPHAEKIEKIHFVQGRLTVLIFDEEGKVINRYSLGENGLRCIDIPAFSWHTYIMQSDYVVTYETMVGQYDPKTWKTMATWAPVEDDPHSHSYLNSLKEKLTEN